MKQTLKGGFEYDWTSAWRKNGILKFGSGVGKYIKRKMNKRYRKEGKDETRDFL